MAKQSAPLGKKIRALRMKEGLTQAALAERLGISASYLNLIENDRRSLSADLLLRLARVFDLDLKGLAGGEDAQMVATLLEVFGNTLFEGHGVGEREVRELVSGSPEVA